MRTRLTVAFALAAAAALAAPTSADEKPKAPPAGEKAKAAPAGMPSQEEMMRKWQAYATPGDAHKRLDAFVGTWNVKMKSWMAPGQPPEETEGTAENKWLLGNRYLEQRYEGKMMNQPFSGIGYTGYDNFKKKYESVWMDNMGTGTMMSTGSFDKSGKMMRFTATMDDPVTGEKATVKESLTVVDSDTHKLEMWMTGPDGKMFKTLEGVYTRKK